MGTAECNPFRVSRIEALSYRAPGFSWTAFLETLAAHAYRGAIVGPHGSGKTTLLLEARQRLEDAGVPVSYGFLNEATPSKGRAARDILANTPRDTVLFLDGAEQIDSLTWRWLRWRSRDWRGLVITTHAPGRLPTLYRTATSEALLRDLLGELAPDGFDQYWERARGVHSGNQGNIRDTFFALYDDWAQSS